MVGNDLEIEIIELFRQDITRLLSINQISKELGKAYPYIYKKMIAFIEAGIFNTAKIGQSILCSINLQCEEAIILLTINELKKKKQFLKQHKEFIDKVEKIKVLNKEVPIQTALHVKGKIILVTDNLFYKKTLQKEFSNAKPLTKIEFQQEILENYPKIQTHTLLYHNEKYYEILSEIEQELKMKHSPINQTS